MYKPINGHRNCDDDTAYKGRLFFILLSLTQRLNKLRV